MYAQPLPFPLVGPPGFDPLPDEPVFVPTRHLALKRPRTVRCLAEFGYGEEEIAECPSPVAVTEPFRVLSDEGAAALLRVARSLKAHSTSCERIEHMVRGGTYRSRFLRDLCTCPVLTAHVSEIMETTLAPHSMPLQLGHLNFAPDDLSRAVDKWHHDTLGIDFVMMVSEPTILSGGSFEYFVGTKREASALAEQGLRPPKDRIVAPQFPAPGFAVLQQGNMVVHRGAKLIEATERITMVNGYVPLDLKVPDVSRFSDLKVVDPHFVLFPEWARHKAWLASNKLAEIATELDYTEDRASIVKRLRLAIADIEAAIMDLEDETEPRMIAYE